MKDFDDILANVEDQDRGAEVELRNPATGEPTGLKLTVAGPDSLTQRRSRLQMSDELAELARADGTVSAEEREKAAVASLARCVLSWQIVEGGKELTCTHANIVRLLSVAWVREQVDAFAGNRANFMAGAR
ncbi:hypothetical protein GOA89_13170 [Sinorhizobium meliloti]|nr:hypothetical protein [Sinorhizobium meliloti]MDW9847247.1 hypothetical protein [Sinorhizobium meliloti]MDX0147572.1 hypothetical protein [Sinorhizobium meliloti]MDX0150075.1 hypothetical protein [Sinorhizobium meliloti]MDX0169254.1 hypothetical protein [Sinorhizobium meliloti]